MVFGVRFATLTPLLHNSLVSKIPLNSVKSNSNAIKKVLLREINLKSYLYGKLN